MAQVPFFNIFSEEDLHLNDVEGFRGWSPLRKFLGSKEYLDCLKIDLNAVEIRTVQDYTRTIIIIIDLF